MKQKKFFIDYATHLSTACAVVGMILIIPAAATKIKALGVVLYILCALLLAGGGVILYLGHRAKSVAAPAVVKGQPKADASEDALSFADVLEGIDSYLDGYIRELPALILDTPKELRIKLEREQVFRPVVALRLLWELSGKEEQEILYQFTEVDEKAVGYLCGAICDAGERELADFIFEMKRNAQREQGRIPTFFRKNRGYFEARMTAYVTQHMEEFGSDE